MLWILVDEVLIALYGVRSTLNELDAYLDFFTLHPLYVK